ncbi:hypothetical protein GCM10027089_42740 [Nocardia thraciensis]
MSGHKKAAITHPYPTAVQASTPLTGTPRWSIEVTHRGASPRDASTNNILDDVYKPEFKHERTAARTTMFMIVLAPGTPIVSSTVTNGDRPGSTVFHGWIVTIRKVDRTKNNRTRIATELVVLLITRPGSGDSAAAIVTTSTPVIEKMTTTMPDTSGPTPLGRNPPTSVRCPNPP